MSALGAAEREEAPSVRDASLDTGGTGVGFEVWVRRGCALVVASVAGYASYVHQRAFALQGGADAVSATLWPLSVDGLLLLATVGLLTPNRGGGRRARAVVWLAFLLGIAVSLAANVAAAPALAWKPMLVVGWPPVALLLSVELLAHRSGRRDNAEHVRRETGAEGRDETSSGRQGADESGRESVGDGESARHALPPQGDPSRSAGVTVEEVMGSTSSGS
ncbi:DUF2637 domain-containing protein [Streptomyces sp. GESEQ-35]|uniref:DUF2637 domain-containing protein n=1 Tax=Streptomyces sp. GESEQ-35 TaxID=2812657 RepID=UPI0027E258B4|nr:DUF2637 domain-containing protein [Streptomyces sp. GESEQ-35]